MIRRSAAHPSVVTLHNARTLFWPSQEGKAKVLLLFIPGNPGLSDQCSEYLGEVHRQLHADGISIEIYCPSQLGHDPLSQQVSSKVVSLDEQIQNKADILNTALSRCIGSKPKVILGGHSIGAWMIMEMLRRDLCKCDIHSLHLLFPAVYRLSQMPNAKKSSIVFQSAFYSQDRYKSQGGIKLSITSSLFDYTVWLLRYIVPYSFIRYLVQRDGPDMPASAIRATALFFKTPACISQAFCMAHEQFSAVQDVATRIPTGTMMRLYWADGDTDGWAPSKARVAVEEQLSLSPRNLGEEVKVPLPARMSIICSKAIPHAFFLKHSVRMAEETTRLIRLDWGDSTREGG